MTAASKATTGNPAATPEKKHNYEMPKVGSMEVPTESRETDTNDQEQRLQERAYFLWLSDGSPEGRADIHWEQARQFEEEEARGRGGRD
jgi:hypothetical protein